jgi:lipoate---protein ligase
MDVERVDEAMHGEYKTPGGKLVIVDFEVEGDRLRRVMVSGDFFLYPEETLDAIVAGLEGVPVTLSEAELAAAIDGAIPDDAQLLGFSPLAIAIAVRRGLMGGIEGGVA